MKKQLIAAVLALIFFVSNTTYVYGYSVEASDVPSTHPNYSAINALLNEGIMQGYPDGRFRPNQPINRVEALKIVIRSVDPTCCTLLRNQYTFRDTEPGAWYVPYLLEGLHQGIISGYADGYFRPTQTVTSPELLKMLVKTYSIGISEIDTRVTPYKDVSPQAWYLPYMIFAKNRNILPQKDYVRPEKPLTRGEASELVYRFIKSIDSISGTSSSSQEIETNIYSIPADIRPIPPVFGETEIRKTLDTKTPSPQEIQQTETKVSTSYPQTPVITHEDEWNWWPVYNVSERLQNGIDTKFPDVIFGHVQVMNAWNFLSNTISEINRYTQDHMNYTYQYDDISKPGEYIYTLE